MNHSILSIVVLSVAACSSNETGNVGDAAATDSAASPDGGGASETGAPDTGTGGGMCTAETGAACGTCHKGDGSTESCGKVDNVCNDDSTCNGAENAWFTCLCFAKGDAAASTKCDDTFKTSGGANAALVVTCLRSKCATICY